MSSNHGTTRTSGTATIGIRGTRPCNGYNWSVAHSVLPGADLVELGLKDLSDGVESVPALLVSIGARRLQRLGIVVPHPFPSPERRLYALLQQEMLRRGLIDRVKGLEYFAAVEPFLYRYPSLDPRTFHEAVDDAFRRP